jgi:transposase
MEVITRPRSHGAAFRREIAEEPIAGETPPALAERHDIPRPVIRIWVGRFEPGALDSDVRAADLS